MNILINLDCDDFVYINNDLFRRTIFHSYLNSLNKAFLKINNIRMIKKLTNKNARNTVNSNQSWNHTNDKFIGYGAIKKQKMSDELK